MVYEFNVFDFRLLIFKPCTTHSLVSYIWLTIYKNDLRPL
jgi:hypothetical protein